MKKAGVFKFRANGASQKSAEKQTNINEGADNVKTEQNGNGTRASDGLMSDDEINKLANEGKKLLPFEKYCEQILFGESLQMELADKERAWKQYVAYNVKAKKEGRKSVEYSENSLQKAQKMGERTEAAWKKFLPLKTNISDALKAWRQAGRKLQETWGEQDFKKWRHQAAKLAELMFPPKGAEQEEEDAFDGMSEEESKDAIDQQVYLKRDEGFPEPMREEAFRGISGKVVDLICQNTELNREAVLVQFLVSAGNIVGREPYRWAESEHHTNEFVGIVGTTAAGAKGGSWRAIRDLLYFVDKEYAVKKAHGGYQSPEAIVESIRDDRFSKNADGEDVCEPGEPDKRLLIVEEELSRIFRLSARRDNQISEVVRLAWDEPPTIYLKGKISPSVATSPHISLIGHITPTDLQDTMQNRDTFNGFANRFLWVASRRSKSIPFPQKVNWTKNGDVIAHIRGVMNDFGPNRATPVEECNELEVDESGQKEWIKFYHDVNKKSEKSGMIMGSLLARAKPHVMRLAVIYAILDRSSTITGEHFQAAIAVWDYCVDSATWGFGDKTGNRDADQLLWALKREPAGLTRTEISEVLKRNTSALFQ